MGFGDTFKGDLGMGCYLIDALCQEPLGETVELSFEVGLSIATQLPGRTVLRSRTLIPPWRSSKNKYAVFLE